MSITTRKMKRAFVRLPGRADFTPSLCIACGQTHSISSPDQPVWSAETGYFSGGTPYTEATIVNTAGVVGAAPMSIYQSQRWGQFTYTIPGLSPNTAYVFRLHFAELYYTAAGQRIMDVAANGTAVITGFDIFATVGGQNKACIKEFSAQSDTNGQVILDFTSSSNGKDAKVCGIEVSGVIPKDDTPANLTPVASSTSVVLSWAPPSFPTGIVEGYNIYQGITRLNTAPVSATSYRPGVDSPALSASTQYTFIVKTVIGGNETGQSSVTVTTKAAVSLLFEDTFNGSSLDTTKWVIENHPAGANNNELQSYGNPAAFTLANNTLTISARRDANGNWYSGRIHVANQYALLYGKMEAEMKLPSITGAWPAFWSWAVYGGGWPDGGEIDIVEAINAESVIYSNLHYTQNGGHGQSGPHATSIDITQWHTYAADVRPGYVEFFIDGVSTVIWTQSQVNSWGGSWPFGTVKQGLTLNLAIGGNWPNTAPDPGVSLIEMYVRNVRIYP